MSKSTALETVSSSESTHASVGSTNASATGSKILLPLIGNKVLIFDVGDVKRLRELGVLGVLIGTLPVAPQQNVFLSVPLELTIYEVIWLVENGHAILIDNLIYNQWLLSSQLPSQYNESHQMLIQDRNSAAKLKKLNLSDDQLRQKQQKLQQSQNQNNFIVTKDSTDHSDTVHSDRLPVGVEIPINHFLKLQRESSNENVPELIANYRTYKHIKSQNFYLLPGLRFGGNFVAYPGDPLRFHSHLIVKTLKSSQDSINCLDLVTGGRLATAVKKAWVVCGDVNSLHSSPGSDADQDFDLESIKKPTSMISFSIEWAGFG